MEYVIIAFLLVVVELGYFRLAFRFNITDNPNHRSSHTKPTIRGGGIIFAMAVLFYALGDSLVSWWWIAGLLLISLISLLDDMRSLPNKLRIAVHLIAVSLLFNSLNIFTIWPAILIGFTYILVIGSINAWNFMDGINGITVFYLLSVLLALLYLNRVYSFTDDALIYVLGLASLIFGFFNVRRKAVCFAGDVGAVSIAFSLIFLILSLIIVTQNPIFVLLFAVYGVDSVMTICYRLSQKQNIFEAHRSHLYQLMANEHKIPHLVVSGIYFAAQMLINILLVGMLKYSPSMQWLVGGCILLVLSGVYWFMRFRLMRMASELVSG